MTAMEIIENLYSTLQNKDYGAFRELCSENLEWIQNKGFPKGGHHHGADAVIKNVFQQFEKDWNTFKFKRKELFESKDGTKVTVIGSYIGEHKQTRKTVDAATVHIFELKHSKVRRFRQFTDTATIRAALPSG